MEYSEFTMLEIFKQTYTVYRQWEKKNSQANNLAYDTEHHQAWLQYKLLHAKTVLPICYCF